MTSSDDTCIYQAWGNLTCSSANKNKKSVEMFMDGSRNQEFQQENQNDESILKKNVGNHHTKYACVGQNAMISGSDIGILQSDYETYKLSDVQGIHDLTTCVKKCNENPVCASAHVSGDTCMLFKNNVPWSSLSHLNEQGNFDDRDYYMKRKPMPIKMAFDVSKLKCHDKGMIYKGIRGIREKDYASHQVGPDYTNIKDIDECARKCEADPVCAGAHILQAYGPTKGVCKLFKKEFYSNDKTSNKE